MYFFGNIYLSGETPAEAEASLVDVARKVETYGIRLNAAKVSNHKRDHFNFPIVNFPFIYSNIPAVPVYGVYLS